MGYTQQRTLAPLGRPADEGSLIAWPFVNMMHAPGMRSVPVAENTAKQLCSAVPKFASDPFHDSGPRDFGCACEKNLTVPRTGTLLHLPVILMSSGAGFAFDGTETDPVAAIDFAESVFAATRFTSAVATEGEEARDSASAAFAAHALAMSSCLASTPTRSP